MSDEFIVNGLPLPPLLISLLQEGKWRYPGPTVMNRVIPQAVGRIDLPIEFYSLETIRSETANHLRVFENEDAQLADLFHQLSDLSHLLRGSTSSETSNKLPWLDIEKSLFIAGSEVIGDDIEIGLDYRTSATDPRVVAPAWGLGTEGSCQWIEVTPTFTEFVERLGLV